MNMGIFLLVPALLSFYPLQSFAQDLNSWGNIFDCAVDWFSGCVPGKAIQEKGMDKPGKAPAGVTNTSSLLQGPNNSNLPAPVTNVLENPSLETARAYVAWSRQANEKLARASEYIAQAAREMNSKPAMSRNDSETTSEFALAGIGPVGLYYFFSPGNPSAAKDVTVLNKIWRDGRVGVVGIPVIGRDVDVVNYVNEAKPLFPIRKSDAEIKLVKPAETPDLYLALPLEKKMFRLGPTITETAITEAIGDILAAQIRGKPSLDGLASDR